MGGTVLLYVLLSLGLLIIILQIFFLIDLNRLRGEFQDAQQSIEVSTQTVSDTSSQDAQQRQQDEQLRNPLCHLRQYAQQPRSEEGVAFGEAMRCRYDLDNQPLSGVLTDEDLLETLVCAASDIQATVCAAGCVAPEEPSDMLTLDSKLTFGRHIGKRVGDTPLSYQKFLKGQGYLPKNRSN